ncbi:hypothetical protein QN277_028235 [Acacia crassicarpa]|uniref:Glucose-methanol-choline oxidoreductase N-terminal domain-containing protein n=1 Tax=Acacia crassicarpa TaxID=499986 RepID=A0AAE1MJI3_9FABA|nr:hypothetical protein QN277_028235 [Acacia crassicarpa]
MGVSWWRLVAVSALAAILFSPHLHCASQEGPRYPFMRNATTAPKVSYYDYIIIGGGTAGCPLAATLSQNYRVLLLERGGSPYSNPNITNLASFGLPLADTSPASPAQRFISQDGVINSRARVLGGGSCLNAGFYTRADPLYVRNAGWDERVVNESYEWVERVVAFEPPMRQWQSAVRDGLVEIGVLPFNGFTYDHMEGTKVGGTIFDQQGHRHTAADLLQYADPTRITVLLHATVHRIFFRVQGGSRPVAHGVSFRDASRVLHRAYLRDGPMNEIIVSAGALGSPQLLMLSGIGPEAHLRAHNIGVVLDQPLVGQGMSDNPMNAIFVPSPIPVEVSLIQVVGITHSGSYIEAASGSSFGRGDPRNFGIFSPRIGQFSKVPPKERTREALARAIELMDSVEEAELRGGFILEKIMGPISSGHLELRTRNINDNPLVTFNYLQDPRDLERCVEGMRMIERVIESKAFSPFTFQSIPEDLVANMSSRCPVNLLPKHVNSETPLEDFCRNTVMTIWHYHGGSQVGRVVDSDYKVIGVGSLRVIDGSTFHYSPGTNPQATVMMLGRYMGLQILTQRLAAM